MDEGALLAKVHEMDDIVSQENIRGEGVQMMP